MDNYSKFIAASRYARWQDDKGRRETWEETATVKKLATAKMR